MRATPPPRSLAAPGPEIVAEARSSRRPRAWAATADRGRVSPRRGLAGRVPVPAVVLALLGVAMAAMAWKEAVVGALPPTAPVFAALGLPVNLRGLGLDDVAATLSPDGTEPILEVEGRVRNLRGVAVPVPALRFAVRDKDHRELYHWTVAAPRPSLGAGETVPFEARLAAPPDRAQEVAVAFADGR